MFVTLKTFVTPTPTKNVTLKPKGAMTLCPYEA